MHTFLEKAAQLYYDGTPIITDAEFDYLAKLHQFNQLGSSPSNREGTIPHFNRLYSLDKIYVGDNPPSLATKHKLLVKTPKLDGSCVSLTYVDELLSTAATRGDGFIGENITENFIGWEKIPQEINYSGIVQVVGEIIAPSTIPNARNYAAGATRLKDPKEFKSRDIEFIAYAVFIGELTGITDTYTKDMEYLQKLGFKTVLANGLADIYPTDGIVYRVPSNQAYINEGFTAKHPKGAYALKDKDDFDVEETVLREVIWQLGKSGKVTPVAVFDDIVLNDATVNKATLHNAGFIEDMSLCLEDKILVTRAGGIIPKVLGVVNETT